MFEHVFRSDRDMAQDLLGELIPRQRVPLDDQLEWRGPEGAADLK